MYGGNGWAMGFGGAFMVVFWVLVVIAIFIFVKWLLVQSSGSAREAAKTPLDILRDRYARGEIDRDEYEQKRKDLDHT